MIHQHGQPSGRDDQKLRPKRVVIGVIRGLELDEDEVEGAVGGDQEDDLHDGVVRGDKVGEDVEVACGEDQSK